ncbi:HD superfamily phosphohydrolase [Bacillus atrophaeus]|nr:HD domain-containing protein [Bacillus atrophaeus]MDQ0926463.1 HD superfamily phosphohydrolase [Bacillus atrophaeus]
MKTIDSIYGKFVIDDVLSDLIRSTPIQRLKKIHQGGAAFLINNNWNTTRYQHSIGVMLLIRLLNGSLLDQIKGLLHDISHTAFSHVIDYVYSRKKEDFHEYFYRQIIENSEIPGILLKHGYTLDLVLNYRCDILEEPLPNLSVDRIDYTLQDMYSFGIIKKKKFKIFWRLFL